MKIPSQLELLKSHPRKVKNINTFQYWGGKLRKLDALYAQFPQCSVFYDLFGGSGVVSANLPTNISSHRVYNEIDPTLCEMLKILRDRPSEVAMARDRLLLALESEFRYDKNIVYNWSQFGKDVLPFKTEVLRSGLNKQFVWDYCRSLKEVAMGELLLQYVAFSGVYRKSCGDIAFGLLGGISRRNFDPISSRLQNVKIENKSFDEFALKECEFAYLDPPYTTHSSNYLNISGDGDNLLQKSINWSKNQKGKVVISCNHNDGKVYESCGLRVLELGSWYANARTSSTGNYHKNTEYLLFNY